MVKALAVLFALLIVAAIGHDVYVAYTHPEVGQFPQSFHFSDLGWIWTTYSPDTYKSARESIGPDAFRTWLDPILSQRTAVLAAIPLIILLVVVAIRFLIGKAGLRGAGGTAGSFSSSGPTKAKGQYRYRRHR